MTGTCPACDAPILVVAGSRWGGQAEALDPEPGHGGHYDTLLDGTCSWIVGAGGRYGNLRGKVPLYRQHFWTCTERMQVPMTRKLPGWGGYSHKVVVKGGQQ